MDRLISSRMFARAAFGGMVVAAVALPMAAGCKGLRRTLEPLEPTPTNPFSFHRVAVLPFMNLSGEKSPRVDGMVRRMWLTFQTELRRVRGLSVVPPRAVMAALGEEGRVSGPAEVLELAARLKVEAVIVGAVTDYDPYYKPRVGLALQVYQRRPSTPAPDVLALAERARPFPIRPGRAPVVVLDRVYDSADPALDRALHRYARWRAFTSPLGADRYLRDMEKYLEFVCHRAVADLLEVERKRKAAEVAQP